MQLFYTAVIADCSEVIGRFVFGPFSTEDDREASIDAFSEDNEEYFVFFVRMNVEVDGDVVNMAISD